MKRILVIPLCLGACVSCAKETGSNEHHRIRPAATRRDLPQQAENATWLPPHAPSNDVNDTMTQRNATQCPTIPDTVPSLSRAFVNHMNEAMKLNFLVTRDRVGCIDNIIEEQRHHYERFDGFWDLQDQALVAKNKTDQTCYIAFMGTNPLNPLEQYQNIQLGYQVVPNTDCEVRKGYYDGYFSPTYYAEFRQAVDDCVHSCDDDTYCQLIATGTSRGGAMAVIASMDFRAYDPVVLQFGATAGIRLGEEYPCTEGINRDNMYHFINYYQGNYDSIAMLNTFGQVQEAVTQASHVGKEFLLDDDNAPTILFTGSSLIQRRITRYPSNLEAHSKDVYGPRIQKMVERPCFPIPWGGWHDGHDCHYSDECGDTNSICLEASHTCGKPTGHVGVCGTCHMHDDCQSGFCVTMGNHKVCALDHTGIMSAGCPCHEDRDCESGQCRHPAASSWWRWRLNQQQPSRCQPNHR